MKSWNMLYTQDANSVAMEMFIFFLDHSTTAMIMIVLITLTVAVNAMSTFSFSRSEPNMNPIENFWIITPILLLYFTVYPSLHSLYHSEELLVGNSDLVVKIIGHQWYWSYEYSNTNISHESYMTPYEENSNSPMRLLLADNHLILPSKTKILLSITSEDVIHSWAIPSLGAKTDAIPGRMNQINMMMNRSGLYSGQCSELCGAGHSFMPITISSSPQLKFINDLMLI